MASQAVARVVGTGLRLGAATSSTACGLAVVPSAVSATANRRRPMVAASTAVAHSHSAAFVDGTLCPAGETPTTAQLQNVHNQIKLSVLAGEPCLREASHYYFDGKGKLIRPLIVTLVGRACRTDHALAEASKTCWPDTIERHQNSIAKITEMIHTASLVHDDVIDGASERRGKTAVNVAFTEKECVLAGDFILSNATCILAKIGNPRVIEIFAHVIENLVRGELMQLGMAQDPEQRFNNYIKKSEAKTASLLARSSHCVAVLAGADDHVENAAYEYGRQLGIAFQLIDDLLDVTQTSSDMGKETSVDMKLGLATAPVLFASEEFPELVPLMLRQFSGDGDIQAAKEYIMKSNGIQRTRDLAEEYANGAIEHAQQLPGSEASIAPLADIAKKLLDRQM